MDERTRYGTRHYRIGLLGLTGQRETATEGPDSRSFTRLPDGTLISLRIGTATSYTSSYYTLDELGTVLALTDAAGTTDTARYTYDPYGTILTRTGTWSGLTHHPFRFAGGVTNEAGLPRSFRTVPSLRWSEKERAECRVESTSSSVRSSVMRP